MFCFILYVGAFVAGLFLFYSFLDMMYIKNIFIMQLSDWQ